jgi:PPOX class probable F420-dependent enzyme
VIRMPLEEAELRAFLAEVRLAHWATVGRDGSPRVRPVWYLFEDQAFWFTTRLEARRTGADIMAGSKVAVSIADDSRPYRAAVASGTPEVWTADRDRWLERIAIRYGEAEGRRWLAGALKEPDRAVLRLLPERLLAWHYGKGDYARLQNRGSLRVELS